MYPQTQPTKSHTLKVRLNKIIAEKTRNKFEKVRSQVIYSVKLIVRMT